VVFTLATRDAIKRAVDAMLNFSA